MTLCSQAYYFGVRKLWVTFDSFDSFDHAIYQDPVEHSPQFSLTANVEWALALSWLSKLQTKHALPGKKTSEANG
jgi:hypothetical protein